jgi:hypothetical protein
MGAISRKLERLGPLSARARSLLVALAPLEPALYVLVSALGTLHVAGRFYGSLRLQTLYSDYWTDPSLWSPGHTRTFGPWSAPLDDVFIHFDFARSTARGHPFEWCAGNGYSSGSTSLLYPFLLAVGYALGFQGLELMHFAAVIACVSVFALLLALRRAFDALPVWTTYLLPLSLLGVGALSWAFFSGMEIAFFMALFGGAFVTWLPLVTPPVPTTQAALTRCVALGLWGAVLTATRPEAAVTVLLFAVSAAWSLRGRGLRRAVAALVLVGTPGALVVIGSALANFVLTGEAAAAGAIAKLELYHPYLSGEEKLDLWFFYLGYQALRLTQEHLESIPFIGWLVWVAALAALCFKETRRPAALLWCSFLSWAMTVALNGQVRWQNERYSMPALAWLLTAATLGAGAAIVHGFRTPRHQGRVLMAGGTLVALAVFVWQAEPNFRFQVWYFGRGARNIYDQHVTLGRALRHAFPSEPTVLVGDAGAIPYVSEGPTLDLIGLGGYKGLPFARATRAHVGSAVELIEHLAPNERPKLLAIYPSWWDELPLWFGTRLFEVPARGNVICGAPSAVVYRANWDALAGSSRPFRLAPGTEITAEFDWADVMSEASARYERLPPSGGRVAVKLLANPAAPSRDVFDAGRNSPEGTRERFTLEGIRPNRPLTLVFRAAPVADLDVPVSLDGTPVGHLRLPRTDGWIELELHVPPVERSRVRVELGASGERVLYHVWAVQQGR